jgi:hypothetical protein
MTNTIESIAVISATGKITKWSNWAKKALNIMPGTEGYIYFPTQLLKKLADATDLPNGRKLFILDLSNEVSGGSLSDSVCQLMTDNPDSRFYLLSPTTEASETIQREIANSNQKPELITCCETSILEEMLSCTIDPEEFPNTALYKTSNLVNEFLTPKTGNKKQAWLYAIMRKINSILSFNRT